MHSRLRRTDISRPASSSSTDFTIEGDISPSLADPALLSVVGVVDGQFAGFITKERMNFIYRAHWSRLLCFYSISRPASSKNATSDVISSQPIACPSDQSRSRSVFSTTRKVGSAFFRTHVYCDYSPCFADPAWLSVVGFCGL